MEEVTEKIPMNNDTVDRLYVRATSSSTIARGYLLRHSLVTKEAKALRATITQAEIARGQYEKLMGEKNPNRLLCLRFPRTLYFGIKQKETILDENTWYKLRLIEPIYCGKAKFYSFSSREVIDLFMRARLYDTILTREEWKEQLPQIKQRKKEKRQEQKRAPEELATQRKEAKKNRELYYVAQLTKQDQE